MSRETFCVCGHASTAHAMVATKDHRNCWLCAECAEFTRPVDRKQPLTHAEDELLRAANAFIRKASRLELHPMVCSNGVMHGDD